MQCDEKITINQGEWYRPIGILGRPKAVNDVRYRVHRHEKLAPEFGVEFNLWRRFLERGVRGLTIDRVMSP